MPLNRPALTLGGGPRGVRDARRWVVNTCLDIQRPELCECAELGVSELVTNALMHAEPPVEVRVRGTVAHPRVEVRDGSHAPPELPTGLEHLLDEDLPLTVGRGLTIVSRAAEAWGAEIEEDGKVVWFAPGRRVSEEAVPGLVSGEEADAPAVPDNPVHVTVPGVPLDLYAGFQRHFRELRREVRLLALAHQADYPLARDLSEVFGVLEHELRDGIAPDQLEDARNAPGGRADAALVTSSAHAHRMEHLIDMLRLADEFCHQERLLSLARSDEQRRFQEWYLGEFVRQGRGEPPRAWDDVHGPGPRSARR